MIPSNYHTHTNFCDGKNTPEELVLEAIRLGCPKLGFSGHSYTFFDESYCMSQVGTLEYIRQVRALQEKYADRIFFAHIRQLKLTGEHDFCEAGHLTKSGDLDIYGVVGALVKGGFDGYVRPDHGRNIWGEDGKPGYGLYDRALGATYLYGLFEAIEKGGK